jgi:regulator of replication initiation timing
VTAPNDRNLKTLRSSSAPFSQVEAWKSQERATLTWQLEQAEERLGHLLKQLGELQAKQAELQEERAEAEARLAREAGNVRLKVKARALAKAAADMDKERARLDGRVKAERRAIEALTAEGA